MSTSSLTVAPDGTVSCSDSDPAAAQAAAKNLTVIVSTVTSAADRAHRPWRLDEVWVVDAVARRFAPHRRPPGRLDRGVVGAAAQQPPQVGLLDGEQATPELPVGGQPDAVTGRAEGARHRGDDPDLSGPAGRGISNPPQLGRRRPRGAGSGSSVNE